MPDLRQAFFNPSNGSWDFVRVWNVKDWLGCCGTLPSYGAYVNAKGGWTHKTELDT